MLHETLARQTHPSFEIVYVVGPTVDGTSDLVASWAKHQPLKIVQCPERNLSHARNLGIKVAAGGLIAFIDDDALPEPEWLANLAQAFAEPDVGGAGGAVFDPSGVDYQFLYSAADRLGNSHHDHRQALETEDYPFSALFPHVMGANCMFTRQALFEVGGFDEEYEYYLDETDLCCRLIDAGYRIKQRQDAPVHHKFLSNELRTENRILISKYPILKNKLYFALRNGRLHYSAYEIEEHVRSFFEQHRGDLAQHVAAGRVGQSALDAFDRDTEKARRVGRENAMRPMRRTRSQTWLRGQWPLETWPSLGEHGRSTMVFLAAEGNDSVEAMAKAEETAADPRKDVHLVVAGHTGVDDVSFSRGIWIRRRIRRYHKRPDNVRQLGLAEDLWNAIASVDAEIQRIESLRSVDKVTDLSGFGLAFGPLRRGWKGDIECLKQPSHEVIREHLGRNDLAEAAKVLGGALNKSKECKKTPH